MKRVSTRFVSGLSSVIEKTSGAIDPARAPWPSCRIERFVTQLSLDHEVFEGMKRSRARAWRHRPIRRRPRQDCRWGERAHTNMSGQTLASRETLVYEIVSWIQYSNFLNVLVTAEGSFSVVSGHFWRLWPLAEDQVRPRAHQKLTQADKSLLSYRSLPAGQLTCSRGSLASGCMIGGASPSS